MKEKRWIGTLLVTLLLLGGLLALMWQTGFFQSARSLEAMQSYMSQWAPYSHLVFFLVQFASVVLAPIPSNITAAAGAVLFGTLPAFLMTAAAVLAGSMLVFALARGLGQSFVNRVMSERVSVRYLTLIREKRDSFLVLVFLFPFFPDDLICILAGLTDISWRRFFVIAALTRPWGLLVACAVGGSVITIPLWGMVLLGTLGVILLLLGMKYGTQVESALMNWMGQKRKRRTLEKKTSNRPIDNG